MSESIHRKGQTAELIDEKTGKFNDSKLNIKNGSVSSNVNESEHLTIDNENSKLRNEQSHEKNKSYQTLGDIQESVHGKILKARVEINASHSNNN